MASCPNGVLRPSTDLSTLMQPESSYERGYCRPECTRCSEVCPAGAILKIDAAEKSSVQIGRAVWIKENCIPTYRWRGVWQLCPPLSCRSHNHGFVIGIGSGVTQDTGCEHRAMYRLRSVRESVSVTSVQCHLCRRQRTPPYYLNGDHYLLYLSNH